MPFNWKTPFGYLIANFIETLAFYTTVLICVPLVCSLIGPSSFFKAIATDVSNEVHLLDVDDKTNQSDRKNKENFFNAVQLFADAKELSEPVLLLLGVGINNVDFLV